MKHNHGSWRKKKRKRQSLADVMAHLAESLRRIAILLQPFLTQTPKEIFAQLGIEEGALTSWDSLEKFGAIPEGTKLQKGEPIFPRLDIEEEVEYIKEKMQGTQPKIRTRRKKK